MIGTLGLLLTWGCGGAPDASRALTVLAASSLRPAFTALEPAFETEYPDVDVVLSFAGSQTLATQVRHGISADVFASADALHVAALEQDGLARDRRVFARNTLVLAVAADVDPVDLASLDRVQSLVVGMPQVPVGRYTIELLDAAQQVHGDAWRQRVDQRIVSQEASVRLVLAKVIMGEADAAVVYASDLYGAEGLHGVALPADLVPTVTYHQARLPEGPAPGSSIDWMAFVQGPRGREILERYGFEVAAP
ncbi:MAG: molybdate ABC transporter substrate-binding protein [Myxococcota bacterium]|nr:molybdate ABC transporter substrate-binding protein [Myxococcota bacterium]